MHGAVADVVMVHLWASDLVGEEGAVGTERLLLRQVLEEQAGSGGKVGKVVMVVHDDSATEGTSVGAPFKAAVLESVQEVWESVVGADPSLPAQMGKAVQVSVQLLPDPALDGPGFAQAVEALRAALGLEQGGGAASGGGGGVEAGAVAAKVQSAWKSASAKAAPPATASAASQLAATLPEAELLGMLQVDEAYQVAASKIDQQLKAWRRSAESGALIASFGNKVKAFSDSTLDQYNRHTVSVVSASSPLASARRSQKYAELTKTLRDGVGAAHAMQVESLTDKTVKKFENTLMGMVGRLKDPSASIPDDKASKALRAASLEFAAQSAQLAPPKGSGGMEVAKLDDTMGQMLAQILADFDESPACKVLRMNRLQRKMERSKKQPKNPRAITPGFHLAGLVRQVGSGNLSGFAGYALGAHTVNFGYANDRGDPESGDTSPLLRLQPKIHFDVDL